jgi:cytidine deaminase
MKTSLITAEDELLIAEARAVLAKYYTPGKHHVGAAIRTKTGRTFAAVHLEANVGRVAVCAEAIALGKAISEGESAFDTIVAVRRPGAATSDAEIAVVSPCGICRELLSDYGADMQVIFADAGVVRKCGVLDLLPGKYTRGAADAPATTPANAG